MDDNYPAIVYVMVIFNDNILVEANLANGNY